MRENVFYIKKNVLVAPNLKRLLVPAQNVLFMHAFTIVCLQTVFNDADIWDFPLCWSLQINFTKPLDLFEKLILFHVQITSLVLCSSLRQDDVAVYIFCVIWCF